MNGGPSTVAWCGHGTRTYIIITMTNVFGGIVASQPVQSLLVGCMNIISYEIERNQDGPIDGGYFRREISTSGVSIEAWNANNHQITYGVLGVAVGALTDYMQISGWGTCAFSIFDGSTRVGAGRVAFGPH